MTNGIADMLQHRIRHDVDQPLFGIRLLLQQLRHEDTATRIDAIGEGVECLGADFHRLLRYTLAREGLIPEVSEPLMDVCDRAKSSLAAVASLAGTDVVIDGDTAPDTVVRDAISLEYALVSVLENAIEFAPNSIVRLRVICLDGGVLVTVTDTGCGLPSVNDQKAMYDPFTTFRAHLSSRPQRWGLGLATARLAAERVGGRVGLATDDDGGPGGAVATIWLP